MFDSDVEVAAFRHALLSWYGMHARNLPWRNSEDPYHIWLSEIMLQQTRVDQARPYFERFVSAFPAVTDLAEASLDEVLVMWEGLGYYSRARNLHRAARQIVADHDGVLPDTYEDIRALPGIGPYTAAAILSIAFSLPYGVLDGNVIRVLTRLACNENDPGSTPIRRLLQEQSDSLVDPGQPGDFNQAMMELGATVCTPRNPACAVCPVQAHCCAFGMETQERFPRLKKKAPVPHYDIAAGIVSNEKGEVLIQRRPEDGLLGGLWEFPGIQKKPDESLESACRRAFQEEFGVQVHVVRPFHSLSHAFSHFRITLHAYFCALPETRLTSLRNLPVRWAPKHALNDIAFSRAHRRLIDRLLQMDP